MHMNTFKLKLKFLVTKRIENYVLQISHHILSLKKQKVFAAGLFLY